MSVSIHVRGEIEYGRLHEFMQAVETFKDYRKRKGYVVPQVYLGLSGPMNTVLMTYDYDDLKVYEEEETGTARDREYARIASKMPYLEGTIHYEVFREV